MRIALWDIAAAQQDRLRALLAPDDEIAAADAAPGGRLDVDVLIASRFSAAEAARATFRLLQVPGAGLDRIDLAAVPDSAVVCNAFEHESPIAEYVMAAILEHAIGLQALMRTL